MELSKIYDWRKRYKTSVVVPLKTWEKINEDHTTLRNKLKTLTGIKEGLKAVKEANKSGKKLEALNN